MLSLYLFRANVVYQLRLLLLCSVGIFCGFVKVLGPNFYFAPIGIDVQSYNAVVKISGLTALALIGAAVGLRLGDRSFQVHRAELCNGSIRLSKYYFYISVFFIFLISKFTIDSFGPTAFSAAYASSGEGQALGNLQSIGIVLLAYIFFYCASTNMRLTLPIFLTFLFLGYAIFIRGGRMDVINGLLTIIVAIYLAKGQDLKFRLKYIFPLFLFVVIFEVWGMIRTLLAGDIALTAPAGWYAEMLDSGIIFVGTLSMIAVTFANSLAIKDFYLPNFPIGSHYIDYIARIPPAFVYPDRPRDPSWMFADFGLSSVGGYFELGEAYLNLGYLGCIVVPFVVSFVISKAYRLAFQGKTMYIFILFALISVFFRGGWYQSFAFFKALFTGLILYFIFVVITGLTKGRLFKHQGADT